MPDQGLHADIATRPSPPSRTATSTSTQPSIQLVFQVDLGALKTSEVFRMPRKRKGNGRMKVVRAPRCKGALIKSRVLKSERSRRGALDSRTAEATCLCRARLQPYVLFFPSVFLVCALKKNGECVRNTMRYARYATGNLRTTRAGSPTPIAFTVTPKSFALIALSGLHR